MKVRTFNKIAEDGIEIIKDRIEDAECGPDVKDPDAIILRSHKLAVSDCAGAVAVARAGAGVNNVPVADLTERGIIVFNTPGANANAVAELTIGSMISSARHMPKALDYFDYSGAPPPQNVAAQVEQDKKTFKGSELRNKKLLVVGLGAIGRAVAKLGIAFGMKVAAIDPFASPIEGLTVVHDWKEWEPDYYTFHVPPTPETKNLAAQVLDVATSTSSVILNFSRGELFDSFAVISACTAGLGRYITDFADNALVESLYIFDKILCYPHLGASTKEAETNCSVMAAEQLCDLWEHGIIRNSVNFPELPMMVRDRGTERLLVLHRNESGALKNITSRIADLGANVNDMLNRAKGEYAATLIDIDGPAELTPLLKGEETIKGVLSLFKVADRPISVVSK